MDPQARFDSFLAYLEDSPSLTPDQKREIEARIEEFQPYQSEYLPMVFPGGLQWLYAEDRGICTGIINNLFHNGNLKASRDKLSDGWKLLRIENPDFLLLDLLYSYKNNISNLSGLTIINKLSDKKIENIYTINVLTEMKDKLKLLTRNDNDINYLINTIDETIVKIYDKSDILSKEVKRKINKDYKHYSIVRHLAIVIKNYASEIASNVLCKRIEELLVTLYPDDNYNFDMIKKDLHRHKLL